MDILLVSPSTTAGWRRVDSDFRRLLEELELSVAVATSEYRIARHLRRTVALTDLAEAAAMRTATTRALGLSRPRAIVYSSTQATMLQPRGRLGPSTAVRFDALTTVNRPGTVNAIQHRLERRSLDRVGLLLPAGLDPNQRVPAELKSQTRVVALPLPVEATGGSSRAREPIALCYAANPDKKGLATVVRAWQLGAGKRLRLIVTGIGAQDGAAFLRSSGVSEPPAIEWAGSLEAKRFRELTASAEVFLSASRFEDYGLAQLEAMADGALLVTTPSRGPYEALPLARCIDLRLVAADSSARALSAALRSALSMSEAERAAYRRQARELLAPYSWAELRRRVQEQVLPVLLG